MEETPAESTSQEVQGVVDIGEESFAVDNTPAPVEGKAGDSPAEGKPVEKKVEEKIEGKPAEGKPEEKPAGEEDIPAGVKKRLATITRKRRDAERETTTVRAQNEELLKRIEALERPPELSAKKEPQIDDFDTEGEYFEACGEYKADQIVAERDAADLAKREKQKKEDQGKDAATREEALRTKLQKGVEKFEDFEDVIEDLNITGDMVQILEHLPNVPEVVYELGRDAKIVAELIDMPFLKAAYKMKEISDGLVKKKSTKAPTPIVPVSSTGGSIKSLENMSMAEYTAHMDKKDAERKGMHI